jgi:hypothetical protein
MIEAEARPTVREACRGETAGKRASLSLRQIGWVARVALLEARRQSWLQLLLLAAVVLVFGTRQLREFNFGASEGRFVFDLGSGIIFGFGSILSAATVALLFFGEGGPREIMTWLAKPVGRAEWMIGRYLGALAVIAGFSLLMTGLLAAIVAASQKGGAASLADAAEGSGGPPNLEMLGTAFVQWLQFAVLASLTLFVASFARSAIYTVVASLAVWAAGHFQLWLHDPGLCAPGSALAWPTEILTWVVPDLRGVGWETSFPGNGPLQRETLAWLTARALVHVAGFGGLAVFNFSRREG